MALLTEGTPVETFRIVCLGGSAGGLEAYKEVLLELPADTGMAFIVTSHRGLEGPELLARLLSRVSCMPVIDAENGMLLKPNHVFVIPPQTEATTDGVVLHVHGSQHKREGWPVTISVFLDSLAASCQARAVAVILSGMGHDGSSALGSLKAGGGVTFAQSDALFESMPRCAKDTGYVDYVLTATEIGKHLAAMS